MNKAEMKVYSREHYLRNREKRRQQQDARKYAQKSRVDSIKESNPCADCGGFFPSVCMDFDHINPDKLPNVRGVSHMYHFKWDRLVAEIAKCELVCANCHRLRTQSRLAAGKVTAVAANDMSESSSLS